MQGILDREQVIKPELVKQYKWEVHRHTTMGQYLFEREYAFIKEHLDPIPQSWTLLDVCCGSGYLTTRVHDLGRNVVGLDLNPVALHIFQERAPFIPIMRGDAQIMPLKAGSFGGILATQCLDYLDHTTFFTECERLLRPDGLLVFDWVNGHSYKALLKPFANRKSTLPSINLRVEDVIKTLEAVGFTVQAIVGYSWVPFMRESDSKFVPMTAAFERLLHLERVYKISPKILVAARKR